MGVKGLWDDFENAPIMPLADYCLEFYREHSRHPRIAVDISQWLFEIVEKSKEWGFNEHRQLIRRLAAIISSGADLVMVFDGPNHPRKLRNLRKLNGESAIASLAREITQKLGIPHVDAPGEAEAQCAYLQQTGIVDVVFSNDADVLAYGATSVIFYAKQSKAKEESSIVESDTGPLSASARDENPTLKAASSADRCIKIIDVKLPRESSILRALIQGNDYDTGINRVGHEVAAQIAAESTGFSQELAKAINAAPSQRDALLASWRERLGDELRNNTSKFLRRKCSARIPPNFPPISIAYAFFHPTIMHMNDLPRLQHHSVIDIDSLRSIWLGKSPVRPPKQAQLKQRMMPRKDNLEALYNRTIAPALLASMFKKQIAKVEWFENIKFQRNKKSLVFHLKAETFPEARVMFDCSKIYLAAHIAESMPELLVHFLRDSSKAKSNSLITQFFTPLSSNKAKSITSLGKLPYAASADRQNRVRNGGLKRQGSVASSVLKWVKTESPTTCVP